MAPCAVRAVFEDLVGQGLMVGGAEVEVLEKAWDAGEEADTFDAELVGLVKERTDESAACAVACGSRTNCDGAIFGEVWAVDVERGATDESVGGSFNDGESVDVFTDLRVGAREKGSVVSEAFDQLIDAESVLQSRGASPHQGFSV